MKTVYQPTYQDATGQVRSVSYVVFQNLEEAQKYGEFVCKRGLAVVVLPLEIQERKAQYSRRIDFNFGVQQVRTVEVNGELWFVAKDVCEVVGLGGGSSKVWNHLQKIPAEMKGTNPFSTPGGIQKMSTVNEAGLNRLIMRSDKPEAITFQNWIAKDVLPSIRKHGMYLTPEVALEAKEDTLAFLARAVLVADGELKRLQKEVEMSS